MCGAVVVGWDLLLVLGLVGWRDNIPSPTSLGRGTDSPPSPSVVAGTLAFWKNRPGQGQDWKEKKGRTFFLLAAALCSLFGRCGVGICLQHMSDFFFYVIQEDLSVRQAGTCTCLQCVVWLGQAGQATLQRRHGSLYLLSLPFLTAASGMCSSSTASPPPPPTTLFFHQHGTGGTV